ncbi:MAG: transporter substrate-binding domain-containing protein, partial [Firmicutes bacterium]|nr:transporter substrate-binding domain-containing protein [Bacillota bacterium]
MKKFRPLSILLITVMVFTAMMGLIAPAAVYAEGEEQPNVALNGITTIEELNGKRLGVQTGVLYEDLIKDELEGEEWLYYKLPNDMIPALENNKIDAYLIEEVGYYAQRYEHPELVRLEEAVGQCEFAVIVGNNDKQDLLFSQIQEFIAERKESGWLDDLYDYWVKNWDPNTCKIENI